jgi:hypothetical protein
VSDELVGRECVAEEGIELLFGELSDDERAERRPVPARALAQRGEQGVPHTD